FLYAALYPEIMGSGPLGSETPYFNFIHSLISLAVCGGFTCLLYILGICKRRRKSISAENNPVNPVNKNNQ
ncbi:MAG: hypothetical protein ACYSN7_05500, partial [Planctomycetota bacterium]